MKKFGIVIALLFAGVFCFAKSVAVNYENEKYEELLKNENFDELISQINAVGEENFTLSEFYYLGVCNFLRGNDEEARGYFFKALEKAPKFFDAYDYIAGTYLYNNDFDNAIKNYEECLKIDPKSYRVLKYMGLSYESKNDFKKALEYYERAYKVQKDGESSYNVAYCFYELKNYKKAKSFATKSLKFNNDFATNNLMILILYASGDYKSSEKYKAALRAAYEKSDDEAIKAKTYFPLMSFDYKDFSIIVYEKILLSGDFYDPLTCAIYKADERMGTINLEYDAVTAELGVPYFLGADDYASGEHLTYERGYESFPDFDVFIQDVKAALDCQLEVSASSQKN
ncbi:tetratricopeptide repeat protein [Treponema zioleckii]|uniref:tetratricopeptide repeat protein n=1 Tax=Treponema zioleckii TaxID=331680 RepID=UPI00168B8770|nr:tetratricopeptide repeat protein [Treponema zioleckii]